MNGRGWSAPLATILAFVLLNALLAVLLLHRDSRVHARFNLLEEQVKELQRSVESRAAAPAAAPAPGAPSAAGAAPGFVSPTAPRPDEVPAVMPAQGDWYVQGLIGEPETLNYYVTTGATTGQVARFCLDRLIALDVDAPPKVVPALAWKWDISEDRLAYTFHLRPDARFSDGHPFSADDLMFTWDVIMNPQVNAHAFRSGFVDVEKVEQLDDFTVRVRYRKKFWAGLYAFAYAIRPIPRHWYEAEIPRFAKEQGIEKWSTDPKSPDFAAVFNRMRDMPPGTGPYMYRPGQSWKTAESITLYRNPYSWYKRERPWHHNFDQIRWRIIKDIVAQHEEFRKGAIDVLSVNHDSWEDQISKDEEISRIANSYVYDHTGLGYDYIAWNCRRPPFDDRRVRRAMTMLVDRPTILDKLDRGQGRIASCITKPTYPEYSQDLEPLPFDIEGARRLLAEAGWKDTNGDGILEKDGKDFRFELKYPSGGQYFPRVAALFRDACGKAGIRMVEKQIDWSIFLEQWLDQNFEAAALATSFGSPWHDPFDEWHSSQDVPRGNNTPGWRNEEADRLMVAMREEFDDAKRIDLFHRFNRIFFEDQPMTLIVHPLVRVIQSKRFQDVKIRPTGLQPHDLWVKPEDRRYR